MSLENNPFLELAITAYHDHLSEDELLQRATDPIFLKSIKKARHYDALITSGLVDLGDLPLQIWSYAAAIALRCSARQKIRPDVQGMLHFLFGIIHFEEMNADRALDSLTAAKKLFTKFKHADLVAFANFLLSIFYLVFGRFDAADKMDGIWYRGFSTPRSKKWNVSYDLMLANTYLTIGESEKALKFFQMAQNNSRDAYSRTTTSIAFSRYYYYTGQYERSLELVDNAKRLAQESGYRQLLVQCESARGMLLKTLGQNEEAIKSFNSVLTFSHEKGLYHQVFSSENMLASLYLEEANHAEALNIVERSQLQSESKGLESNVAECVLRRAWIYRKLKRYPEASFLIESARHTFSQQKMDLDVIACDHLAAVISAESGDPESAIRTFDEILAKYAYLDPVLVELSCVYGKGLSFQRMGRFDEARTNYDRGIVIIEGLRGNLVSDTRRSSYLESKHEVYLNMIKCCLDAHDYEAALEYVERLKTRNLAEMLARRDYLPKKAAPEEIEEYKTLRSRIRMCEYRISKEQDTIKAAQLNEELSPIRESLESIINRIRSSDPEFDPFPISSIRYEEILSSCLIRRRL